ncbi:hypothetical protein NDU88_000272 [Pleurodeles waltl]|uniref:Uncharacterized protein n=1 Tax=Pleurodeles waltl TaxID=8319 RepID=A0AAV7S6D4_PLEWA|nr:hypothetical protein NDU88_000272 [Pleurodeles waltl]
MSTSHQTAWRADKKVLCIRRASAAHEERKSKQPGGTINTGRLEAWPREPFPRCAFLYATPAGAPRTPRGLSQASEVAERRPRGPNGLLRGSSTLVDE